MSSDCFVLVAYDGAFPLFPTNAALPGCDPRRALRFPSRRGAPPSRPPLPPPRPPLSTLCRPSWPLPLPLLLQLPTCQSGGSRHSVDRSVAATTRDLGQVYACISTVCLGSLRAERRVTLDRTWWLPSGLAVIMWLSLVLRQVLHWLIMVICLLPSVCLAELPADHDRELGTDKNAARLTWIGRRGIRTHARSHQLGLLSTPVLG